MLGTRNKDQINFLYYSVCNFKLTFECLCPSVFLFVSLSLSIFVSFFLPESCKYELFSEWVRIYYCS